MRHLYATDEDGEWLSLCGAFCQDGTESFALVTCTDCLLLMVFLKEGDGPQRQPDIAEVQARRAAIHVASREQGKDAPK